MSLLNCDRCEKEETWPEPVILAGNYKARLCDKCANKYALIVYSNQSYIEYDNLFCAIEKIIKDPAYTMVDLGDHLTQKREALKKLHKMSEEFVNSKT
ncbi:hypothetical protein KAR91_34745 [Candidatus Pacearchaeota archaeon]|nr:hypothetical protein [Candidatus Pacearchaeota archaeon]